MDSVNGNQTTGASSQNELDFGFDYEPITPKKSVPPSESLLGKAKGFFSKKEPPEPQFHVRKEPTFGESEQYVQAKPFPPSVTESAAAVTVSIPSAEAGVSHPSLSQAELSESRIKREEIDENKDIPDTATTETSASQSSSAETVVIATASRLKTPERWKILQILPEKHRRLFITLLGFVLLLIIFLALKPKSDSVVSFEQQNSHEIPIQFQPLDQSKSAQADFLNSEILPFDNTIADSASMVELQSAQNTPIIPLSETIRQMNQATAMPKTQSASTQTNSISQVNQAARMNQSSQANQVPQGSQSNLIKPAPNQQQATRSTDSQTDTVDTVEKSPSAVENKSKSVSVPTEKKQPVAVVKKAPSKQAPIVEAKVAKSAAAKTLTIPQGVSLMQVFRNHNLNIADVNAMSKAAGADGALSRFKSGDKVQVMMTKDGRVSELRLSNGAKFIRQTDGNYKYQK